MLKNKYLVGSAVTLVIIGLTAGGFWLWRSHSKPQVVHDGAASINTDSTSQPASNTAGGTTGLSVSASTPADNLGQLNNSQKSSSTTAQSQGTSSGSSSAGGIDPSTFGQYDKYKSNNNALFGDAQAGNGTELTANHQAAVYYKGWLTNGTLFDESRPGSDGKLQPFTFTLGAHQVIPGWEEGVTGMKVGGTRLIIVPPSLGYGATGQGSVPPNAVLVFEVQLLAVQ